MTHDGVLHLEEFDVFLPVLLEAGLVARAVFGRLAVVARRCHLDNNSGLEIKTCAGPPLMRVWNWPRVSCFSYLTMLIKACYLSTNKNISAQFFMKMTTVIAPVRIAKLFLCRLECAYTRHFKNSMYS